MTRARSVLDYIRSQEDALFSDEIVAAALGIFPWMTRAAVTHTWRSRRGRPNWRCVTLELSSPEPRDDDISGLRLAMPRSFALLDWQIELVRIARSAQRATAR